MMRKWKINTLGFLHGLALLLPFLVLAYMVVIDFNNGFTAVDLTNGVSQSLNYDHTFDLESLFANFMTDYSFSFGIVDIDFLDLMEINSQLNWVLFINWYCNYLINIELVLFLPEILLIVLRMMKRIVLCWEDKIKESY